MIVEPKTVQDWSLIAFAIAKRASRGDLDFAQTQALLALQGNKVMTVAIYHAWNREQARRRKFVPLSPIAEAKTHRTDVFELQHLLDKVPLTQKQSETLALILSGGELMSQTVRDRKSELIKKLRKAVKEQRHDGGKR